MHTIFIFLPYLITPKKMNRYLLFILLAISSTASAVVIRSDVDDAQYQIPASTFPALADMLGEGYGVLIAPQWVVTAAHVSPSSSVAEITVNGTLRRVERVVIHPGFKKPSKALISEVVASGDAAKLVKLLASSDDIALVKLALPITDVIPVPLYRGDDEVGKTIQLIGKGATGNGNDGESHHGSHRTRLRRAFNVVVDADARWLSYTFDQPPSGLPLEGISGSGDSGGPVIIENKGDKQLVGLTSWDKYLPPSKVRAFHGGLYAQVVNNVRISRYVTWIESVMSANASAAVNAAGD